MAVIPGRTAHYAGVVTGALVGIGAGATAMHFLGRTQGKVDANEASKREVAELAKERDQLRRELDAGLERGDITMSDKLRLEGAIKRFDSEIKARNGASRAWSENWVMSLGAVAGISGGGLASKLDSGFGAMPGASAGAELLHGNFRYKGVVTKPGSDLVFYGDFRSNNVGRKVEWIKQGREKFTFAPGFVAGVAGGVVAGMVGMRLVQQFTNRPSAAQ